MDPFDEFEFKPLTEGLGFHKKQVDLQDGDNGKSESEANVEQLLRKFPELSSSPDESSKVKASVVNTLPRKDLDAPSVKGVSYEALKSELDNKKKTQITPQKEVEFRKTPEISEVDTVKKTETRVLESKIGDKSILPEKIPQKVIASSNKIELPVNQIKFTAATPNFLASIFDAIVIFGFANIFMAALLLATGIDIYSILLAGQLDFMTQISIALLFFSVTEFYMVLSRSFFGYSLGEWAFDFQVGLEVDQNKVLYPLRLAWRCFVVALTGFILLPLVSKIFNKDVTGILSGVKLYKRES